MKMAAEWDNLITDGREMPINGSFNDTEGKVVVETASERISIS